MGYLLDTCIISEVRKSNRNPKVVDWLSNIPDDDLFLSVLTIGEIRRGIELLRLKDPASAGAIDRWLGGIEAHYAGRILPVSAATADRWGRLSPAKPLPVTDGLIAATALEYKLTIVTRNTADFLRSGANTINPFS